MGFKINNYEVKEYGLVLQEAYAQLTHLNIDREGRACAMFDVQQSREKIGIKRPIKQIAHSCFVNKDLSTYRQVYESAKETIFNGWTDDIVEGEI